MRNQSVLGCVLLNVVAQTPDRRPQQIATWSTQATRAALACSKAEYGAGSEVELGFRVTGLGFRLGFRVTGLGFRLGFRITGLGFSLGSRVTGSVEHTGTLYWVHLPYLYVWGCW